MLDRALMGGVAVAGGGMMTVRDWSEWHPRMTIHFMRSQCRAARRRDRRIGMAIILLWETMAARRWERRLGR